MSKQTAIQQAIERIKRLQKYENIYVADGMDRSIYVLLDLLELEKDQIKQAFNEGCFDFHKCDYDSPEDYFTQTYEQ